MFATMNAYFTPVFQNLLVSLTLVFQFVSTIVASKEVKIFFASNLLSILLCVGFLYLVKKIVNCLEIIKTHITLLTSNDLDKFAVSRKQIMEEIKEDVKQKIYIECTEQWGRILLSNMYSEIKDEIKTELKADMDATLIEQGILITAIRDEMNSYALVDVLNDEFEEVTRSLNDISKKVTTLAKFPVMKKFNDDDRDISKKHAELSMYKYSSCPDKFKLKFVDSLQKYDDDYKPFFEVMYNLTTVKIHYVLQGARLVEEALEILKSNKLILDKLHIVDHFNRELSKVLMLFTNYKILKIIHTIEFDDLVEHCRKNNITYVRE